MSDLTGTAPAGAPTIHPIPSGTRDVLPDEMRELRAITWRALEAFQAAGYGEVQTPALEYEETLVRGGTRSRPPTVCSTSRGACSCCAPT